MPSRSLSVCQPSNGSPLISTLSSTVLSNFQPPTATSHIPLSLRLLAHPNSPHLTEGSYQEGVRGFISVQNMFSEYYVQSVFRKYKNQLICAQSVLSPLSIQCVSSWYWVQSESSVCSVSTWSSECSVHVQSLAASVPSHRAGLSITGSSHLPVQTSLLYHVSSTETS